MPVYLVETLIQYKASAYVTAENEAAARELARERASDNSLIEHSQEWLDPAVLSAKELDLGEYDFTYLNKKDD